MAAIAQKMQKIEEASRIRSEQTNNFIVTTKEALDAKMETHEEKREAYINELRARLKDHLEGVEKTRSDFFNYIKALFLGLTYKSTVATFLYFFESQSYTRYIFTGFTKSAPTYPIFSLAFWIKLWKKEWVSFLNSLRYHPLSYFCVTVGRNPAD